MDNDCPKCNIEECNVEKCNPKIPELDSYLDKNIINSDGLNRQKILDTIFDKEYDKITNEISENVKDFLSNKESYGEKWVECSYSGGAKSLRRNRIAFKKKDACSIIGQYGEMELNSTAYMLRVLTKAVLGNKDKPIRFNVESDAILTGIWYNDKKYISFENNNENPNKEGMLIMGLGPSAAGKSFMAEQIIEIMKETIGDTFPDFFFNIDGGEYRELSVVYQSVIKGIKDFTLTDQSSIKDCINLGSKEEEEKYGFDNAEEEYGFGNNETTIGGGCVPCDIKNYLILDNYKGIKDLKKFIDTSSIKKKVFDYLQTQKNSNENFIPNLYVPDTLVSCGTGIDRCMGKIKDYVDLTNSKNRWISTLIYQHTTEENCNKEDGFKCLGTTAKGKSREKCESKIYDDSNWDKGYNMGLKYTERRTYSDTYTPGLVLRIHNSGVRGRKSILEQVKLGGDYYTNKIAGLVDKFEKADFYIGQEEIKHGGGTRKRVRRKNVKGKKKTIRKKKCGKKVKKTKNAIKTKKNRKTRKYRNK
jgi:hypothetical protein